MRRRLAFTMVCLGLLALSALAVAAQGAPRFVFKQGDVLTYDAHMSAKGTATAGGKTTAYASRLDGKLVLTVQRVAAGGTAEVRLTAAGKGNMTAGDETMSLDEEPGAPLVLVVTPEGTIVEVRNAQGKKTNLMESMGNLFGASTQIRSLAFFHYTLFGLQLPTKLPAPGKKFTGTYKEEHGSGPDLENLKFELRRVPAVFVYQGPGKYEGRDYLVFTSDMKASGPQETGISIPTTFYFDGKQGRLLAVEQHARNVGEQKMTIDETVKLAAPRTGK